MSSQYWCCTLNTASQDCAVCTVVICTYTYTYFEVLVTRNVIVVMQLANQPPHDPVHISPFGPLSWSDTYTLCTGLRSRARELLLPRPLPNWTTKSRCCPNGAGVRKCVGQCCPGAWSRICMFRAIWESRQFADYRGILRILKLPRQSEDCLVNLCLLCRIRLPIVWANWELFQVLREFVVYIVRSHFFVLDSFFSWDGAQGTSESNFKVQTLRK